MQEASEYDNSLRIAGLYVTIHEKAASLSGDAYNEATKDYRYEVSARPFAVSDGATVCGWSDRKAYTVIKRTEKSLTLRRVKATLLNGTNSGESDSLKFERGSFVGHTSGEQRYKYEEDANGSILVARLTERGWAVSGSPVCGGHHECYDFNF